MKLKGKAKQRARRQTRGTRPTAAKTVTVQFTQAMYEPLPPDAAPAFRELWEAVHPILIAKGNPAAPPEPGPDGQEVV